MRTVELPFREADWWKTERKVEEKAARSPSALVAGIEPEFLSASKAQIRKPAANLKYAATSEESIAEEDRFLTERS